MSLPRNNPRAATIAATIAVLLAGLLTATVAGYPAAAAPPSQEGVELGAGNAAIRAKGEAAMAGDTPTVTDADTPASTSADGTTYYVDSESGDDAAAGTTAQQAWQSFERVNETTFEPGDRILLKAGSVWQATGDEVPWVDLFARDAQGNAVDGAGNIVNLNSGEPAASEEGIAEINRRLAGEHNRALLAPKGSGTDAAPIHLSSYGEGPLPKIEGAGRVNDGILLLNVEHWTVSNIDVSNEIAGFDPMVDDNWENARGLRDLRGVRVAAQDVGQLSGIVIRDMYIHDVTGDVYWISGNLNRRVPGVYGKQGYDGGKRTGGIVLETLRPSEGASPTTYDDVVIEDNVIANTSFGGIMIRQWHGDKTGTNEGWARPYQASGSRPSGTFQPHTNIVLRDNYLDNSDTAYGCNTIIVIGAKGVLIEGNESVGSGTSAVEIDYSVDVVIQRNHIWDTIVKAGGVDSNGIDPDRNADDVLIQYNYIHDTGDGILLCGFGYGSAIVRFNVIKDAEKRYLNPHGSQGYQYVYNNFFLNTKVNNSARTADFVVSSGGSTYANNTRNPHFMTNNVFYNSAPEVTARFAVGDPTTNALFYDNNAYFGPGVTPPSVEEAAVTGDPGLTGNPIEDIANVQLALTSALLGGGVHVDHAGLFDITGGKYTDAGDLAPTADLLGSPLSPPAFVGVAAMVPDSGSAVINGYVRDEYGEAVGGATVSVGEQSVEADARGFYTSVTVPGGVTLTASAVDFADGEDVQVQAGDRSVTRHDLVLGQSTLTTGSLTGVVSSGGGALAQATVTLINAAGESVDTTSTQASGKFTFSDVPKGTGYSLKASKDGFASRTVEGVEVKAGRAVDVSVALSPDFSGTEYLLDWEFNGLPTGTFDGSSDISILRGGGATFTVVEDPEQPGNKYFAFDKRSSGNAGFFNAVAADAQGVITLEARLKKSVNVTTASQLAMYSFEDGNGWNTTNPFASDRRGATFGISRGNLITHDSSASAVTVSSNAAGRWYVVRNVVDLAAGTFDLYVDGELKLDNRPLRTKLGQLDRFLFFADGSNTGDLILDYFRVNKGTAYDYGDTRLLDLAVDGSSVEPGENGTYRLTVSPTTESVQVLPKAVSGFAKVAVNGEQVKGGEPVTVADLRHDTPDDETAGDNAVTISVTGDNGKTVDHILTVKRPDPNSYGRLAGLSVDGMELEPAFDADVQDYVVGTVANAVTEATVRFARGVASQSVLLNGVEIAGASVVVPLQVGANSVSLETYSANGDETLRYTVSITREPPATPEDETPPSVTGLPAGIVNAQDGLVLSVAASDAESGIRSLRVAIDDEEVPATGTVSLDGISGEVVVSAVAINNAGLETRVTETILVVPADGASKAPSKGTLSNTSGWAYGLHDGRFNVVMNLWSGSPGTVYRLYENGTLIQTKILGAGSGASQNVTTPVVAERNGTYRYTAQLINSKGVTETSSTTVAVTAAAPSVPALSHDNWDRDGAFVATANLWWGTNATSYSFTLDGEIVGEGTLVAATPGAQTARVSLSDVEAGIHLLQVTFSNSAGATKSTPLKVEVTR